MAQVNPIFVDQGASWQQMLSLEYPAGTPFPSLDLWEPFMQVRPYPEIGGQSGPLLLDLTLGAGISLDEPSATLSLTINADQSAALQVPFGNQNYCSNVYGRRIPRIGSYDVILRLISDHTQVIRLLEGPFCLDARVSVPA